MGSGHDRVMAQPHHRTWDYIKRSERVRREAYANPAHPCWRCGRTLAEHPPHRSGRAATWHAGHTIKGDNASPLRAEASTCNLAAELTGRRVNRATGYPHPLQRSTQRQLPHR